MNILILLGSILASIYFFTLSFPANLLAIAFVLLGFFTLLDIFKPKKKDPNIVLEFAGYSWTRDQACTHFFITGRTGTGKTARAIVPIILGLKRTNPNTGILAIDSKGDMGEPIADIAKQINQLNLLKVIKVRPTNVPVGDWRPEVVLNPISDKSVPWTTYAKIIVDTATAAGQKGGQAFFKERAKDLIVHTMQSLDLINWPVTLANIFKYIKNEIYCTKLIDEVEKFESKEAKEEFKFWKDFTQYPEETRSGIVANAGNYLSPYSPPDIEQVFSAENPTFSLSEIDNGCMICLSVPQTYQTERKYLNLLLKNLFYLHAFRRFDNPSELSKKNMIVLVLDEGQKTTLLSEDGYSDHATVDELRASGTCVIYATQTPQSTVAAFGEQNKADVFMANLATGIHFRAADEKGAEILSKKLGSREIKKYSGGTSGGRSSRSWQKVDEPWYKPYQLMALREGYAIIKHPTTIGRPVEKLLPFTPLTKSNTTAT